MLFCRPSRGVRFSCIGFHCGLRPLVSDMAHKFGFEHSQLFLLPEIVDDDVGADNPGRFMNVPVDQLDLTAAALAPLARDRKTIHVGPEIARAWRLHRFVTKLNHQRRQNQGFSANC